MKIQSGTNRLKRRTDARMLQLYSLLAIPVFLVILFKYVPMFGIIIAFKDYKYNLGIFGSEWVGFENFKFFFQSNDFLRITKNTLLLNGVFITTGVLAAVTVAILLFELRSRTATIDAGVCAVMSSARMYPAMDDSMIDGRYTCVGFSKKILIDRLKGEMGFDGVVITDDVNMGGYTSYYEAGEIYGRFLEAGHDVLLGVGVDALDRVMNCVERGIVSEERITDACRRVLDLKEKVGLFDDDYTRSYGNREEITI